MPFRTIVSFIRSLDEAPRVIEATRLVAEAEERPHVIGLYVIPSPAVYADPNGFVDTSIVETHEQKHRENSEAIGKQFNEVMRREDMSSEFRIIRTDTGMPSHGVSATAMRADLVIAGQVDPTDADTSDDSSDAIILESGRPVLFVPFGFIMPEHLDRVLIAFNGTREAARAAFDSLPFLVKAKSVEIFWVNARDTEDEDAAIAGAELAEALARHDVKVTASSVTSHGLPIDEAIRQRALEEADLLVTGAYGHSRLRELVFGGVTHALLEDMPCLTLMSK
jgi:nucleotide-binding universal stress UspA family protein